MKLQHMVCEQEEKNQVKQVFRKEYSFACFLSFLIWNELKVLKMILKQLEIFQPFKGRLSGEQSCCQVEGENCQGETLWQN